MSVNLLKLYIKFCGLPISLKFLKGVSDPKKKKKYLLETYLTNCLKPQDKANSNQNVTNSLILEPSLEYQEERVNLRRRINYTIIILRLPLQCA